MDQNHVQPAVHPIQHRKYRVADLFARCIPPYLVVDKDNLSVTLDRLPEPQEIQVPVDIQQVVEFYNRLT